MKITGHYGTVTCYITMREDGNAILDLDTPYARFGWDSDRDGLSFVDPSGGPFIAVGAPLTDYCRDLPERKIVDIIREDDHYLLVLE